MLKRMLLSARTFRLPVALLLSLLACFVRGNQVEVRVEGSYPALQDNAEAFLGEVEGRSADSLRRYVPRAVDQIKTALQALGYYRPEITWEIVGEGPATLRLTVEPGEPVRVISREVAIKGPASSDPAFSDDLPQHPAEGDVLDHGAYTRLRDTITNRARRLGYFDGRFEERSLQVNPEEGTARIRLVYASGERYRLGGVTFAPGHGFSEDLLEDFVTFEPGTPYHSDRVATLSRDLSNSGYFAGVDVNADPAWARNLEIPVEVQLTPRKRRSVAAGVGFSTDVGPRFRGNWREHWINEYGFRRGLETELSEPRQNLTGWYELPLDPPMTDSIRFSTGYQREKIEDIESDILTLGQQWKHQLESDWTQVLSLRWEGERFRIGDDPAETSSLLLPGVSYSKLHSDSPLDPSRGYRLQLEVSGAHQAVLSNVDILHVMLLARGVYTVADRHRFLTRARFGGVATNRFGDVPPSLRFFAGGDQSVRGYGYETLSPEDEDGTAVGGRYLMVGSFEYQYEFRNNWRAAMFFDHGNAVDDLLDPLASGAGIGIRWVSPVGPLRLDVAKGLDPQFGGGWRVHFSMGPEL